MGGYVGINNLARKIKKAYVGVPMSYTPLEYIESTGTQYIDTGVVPKSTTRMVAEIQFATSNKGTMGWGSSGGQESFFIGANNTDMFVLSCSATYVQVSTNIPFDNNKHTFDISNSALKFDNTSYGTGNIGNTATAGQTLYLFGLHPEWSGTPTLIPVRIYSCKIYDGDTLIRDYVPAVYDNNVACFYDLVSNQFCYNHGTGTFTAGSSGQPISIGEKARKIIKGYVGVNGYASLCYYKATPTYKSYIENSVHVGVPSIETTENYYIVAGGSPNISTPVKTVTAYSKEFVATSCPDLTNQAWFQASASFNGCAIFAGGKTASSGSSRTNQCAAYSDNLTKRVLSNLWDSVYESASASNETHCIIGGGSNYNAYQTACRSLDKNFSMSSPSNFSSSRYTRSGARVGNYLVFYGSNNSSTAATDFYDNSNVKTSSSSPYNKIANYSLGLSLDDYAVFFGGTTSGNNASYAFKDCAAYDSNKVLYKFALPEVAMAAQGFSTGEYVWLGYQKDSYVYDNNLVLKNHVTETEGIYGRSWSRDAAILNYGIEHRGDTTRFNIFYA